MASGSPFEPLGGKPAVSHDGAHPGVRLAPGDPTDEQITIATVMNTDGGAFAPSALRTAVGELHAAIRGRAEPLIC